MTFDNKISVILPTLNEEKNLKILVPQISSLFENDLKLEYEIIVVDDGSTDSTNEYISSLMENNKSIKLILRDKEKSLPLSILDGIKSSQFDNVMWLDADGSMTVKAMKKLVISY